jgi:hypothetical protein
VAAEVEWRHRDRGGARVRRTVPLRTAADGTWVAETTVRPDRLATLGTGTWDLRLRVRFRDGSSRRVAAHALAGPGLLRRCVMPSPWHGVVLVRPYATNSGALALRVAAGVRGAVPVLRGRLWRLLH